jgi:hypothetical protein
MCRRNGRLRSAASPNPSCTGRSRSAAARTSRRSSTARGWPNGASAPRAHRRTSPSTARASGASGVSIAGMNGASRSSRRARIRTGGRSVAEPTSRRSRAVAPAAEAAGTHATNRVEPVESAGPANAVEPVEPAGPANAVEPVAAHLPTAHGHRYRRRTLSQPGGGQLVMTTDGTVLRLGADGSREAAWAPDDPEWSKLAIRFGLRVQSTTISPAGRFVEDTRPPRVGG